MHYLAQMRYYCRMQEAVNPFISNMNHVDDEYKFRAVEIGSASGASSHLGGTVYKEGKTFLMDDEMKTGIFCRKDIRDVYGNISPSGRMLFLYVICHLPRKQDWIEFKIDEVVKGFQVSRRTVYSGITGLLSIGIIARKGKSQFWINPKYLFNGSRVNFYKDTHLDCFKIRTKKIKSKDNQ